MDFLRTLWARLVASGMANLSQRERDPGRFLLRTAVLTFTIYFLGIIISADIEGWSAQLAKAVWGISWELPQPAGLFLPQLPFVILWLALRMDIYHTLWPEGFGSASDAGEAVTHRPQ